MPNPALMKDSSRPVCKSLSSYMVPSNLDAWSPASSCLGLLKLSCLYFSFHEVTSLYLIPPIYTCGNRIALRQKAGEIPVPSYLFFSSRGSLYCVTCCPMSEHSYFMYFLHFSHKGRLRPALVTLS